MTLHSEFATTHGRAPDDGAEAVIDVEGLVMRYGKLEAVRGINLRVGRGEVLAFLGPNGAGKTTTVEILEGYRRRSAGHVRVLGEDPANAGPDWRARVGVVLQESAAEQYLTVAECVRLYAGYYTAPRSVDDVLELVGLAPQAGQLAGCLSGGQKRASMSPWRLSATRSCCSSTNRQQGSTRPPDAKPGRWSKVCGRSASPCS